MSLSKKLQIPVGVATCVVDAPHGFTLDGPVTNDPEAGAVLAFARDRKALTANAGPAFAAARADRIAWIAYPKAGQRGTDLDRDILWELLKAERIRPVRQVSIDDTRSALRFRPG